MTLDQELRELRLGPGEEAAVVLELALAGTGRPQLLALGHEPADLYGERLDGVSHAPQATVSPGCQ